MTEPTAPPVETPPVVPVVPVVPSEPTVPLVDANGVFRENWIESLPEDIQSDEGLGRIKDFNGMATSLINAQRSISKGKVAIPDETSTESEWDAFYEAGGRPATAADFNLRRPEEFPEEHYSPELATAAQELFHKIGLSSSQAAALFEFNNSNVLAQLKDQTEAQEAAFSDAKDKMIAEFGNAYQQRIHLGNVAIEQGVSGDEELKARIIDKYGNDPDFIRFSSNLGAKFAEHGAVVTSELVPTPSDMKTTIDEEMAKDAYTNSKNPLHEAQQKKVERLFREMAKTAKTG